MICKKCNAIVSEEGAVYCHECGARLDGKKPCPSCGEYIEEKYTYCVYCGARTDGKVACPSCGTYHNGAFCPDCGTPLKVGQTATVAKAKEEKKSISSDKKQRIWNTLFAWIRSGAGLACAAFALIFVWFIGFTLRITGEESTLSGLGISAQTPNLFYFFGDVYKELASLKSAAVFESDIPLTSGYIYAISGTAVSVATIALVVGFSISAIVGFIRFTVTKKENNVAKWGVGAAIAFLGGTALLYALNAVSMGVEASSGTEKVSANLSIAYNGATVAGIVLCAVFLALYVAGNLVRKGAAWREAKTVVGTVLAAVGAAFAIVAYSVGKGAFVGVEYGSGSATIGFSLSQYVNNTTLATIAENVLGWNFYNTHLNEITIAFLFSIFQQFAALATVVCGAGFLLCMSVSSEAEQPKSGLGWAIAIASCAVAQFVFGIVGQSAFWEILCSMGSVSNQTGGLQLGAGIVTVVFSVLCLCTAIVKQCIQKRALASEC